MVGEKARHFQLHFFFVKINKKLVDILQLQAKINKALLVDCCANGDAAELHNALSREAQMLFKWKHCLLLPYTETTAATQH